MAFLNQEQIKHRSMLFKKERLLSQIMQLEEVLKIQASKNEGYDQFCIHIMLSLGMSTKMICNKKIILSLILKRRWLKHSTVTQWIIELYC